MVIMGIPAETCFSIVILTQPFSCVRKPLRSQRIDLKTWGAIMNLYAHQDGANHKTLLARRYGKEKKEKKPYSVIKLDINTVKIGLSLAGNSN